MKVGFIHLGCSKNLIDTEIAIGIFKNNDFEITGKESEAEILVINTCGFIADAKQEAIDTIFEMAEYKKTGSCKYLVVMGCLVQRYYDDLVLEIPEVDLFIKINEYDKFWDKLTSLIELDEEGTKKEDIDSRFDCENRVISSGRVTTYLKIAEGCSNRCTYCAIPYIRGPFKSRAEEDILKEAEKLAGEGFREIILIAQDTTKYGIDIYSEKRLAKLVQKICEIEGFEWVRVLYSYPESITDELIEAVSDNSKICNYFDIPIQHISDRILKTMNRKSNRKEIEELIRKIRTRIPDCILRTSLIVGFPGETEEDFRELYEFIKTVKFDKVRSVYVFS